MERPMEHVAEWIEIPGRKTNKSLRLYHILSPKKESEDQRIWDQLIFDRWCISVGFERCKWFASGCKLCIWPRHILEVMASILMSWMFSWYNLTVLELGKLTDGTVLVSFDKVPTKQKMEVVRRWSCNRGKNLYKISARLLAFLIHSYSIIQSWPHFSDPLCEQRRNPACLGYAREPTRSRSGKGPACPDFFQLI